MPPTPTPTPLNCYCYRSTPGAVGARHRFNIGRTRPRGGLDMAESLAGLGCSTACSMACFDSMWSTAPLWQAH